MAKKAKTKKNGALRIYRSYLFVDKDPIIDSMRTVQALSKKTYEDVERESGIRRSTLRNWFSGNVKRPQFATVAAFARAHGCNTISLSGGKPFLK